MANRDLGVIIKELTEGQVISGIDDIPIGSTTPKTGAFTNVSASSIIYANGGQIYFPTIQIPSSDPNTLDDYEEGTWTPTIYGSTTAGTCTYGERTGYYAKIGSLVYIGGNVGWSSHTGTGAQRMSGIPFVGISRVGLHFFRRVNQAGASNAILEAYAEAGGSFFTFEAYDLTTGAGIGIGVDTDVTLLSFFGIFQA